MDEEQGFYARRVFPWLNDQVLGHHPDVERLRTEALAAATGRVIEIGFGTGLNLPHYPPTVRELVAVEPSSGMRARADARIAAAPFSVQLVPGHAERLPFPDGSFDTAVSTLTLCTVSDPGRALAELKRVLREDGRLLLLEHGLADDPGVARWQQRLDWLEVRVACGCHLTRDPVRSARDQGWRFEQLRQFFLPGAPRTHGWLSVGLARKALPR